MHRIVFIVFLCLGHAYGGEYCTDARAESDIRYCEYGCCVDSAAAQACCGFPVWILVVGFVGGAIVVAAIIIATCCVAYRIQKAKLRQSVRPAAQHDSHNRVIQVTSPPVYPPASARYSSALESEYSYCAHDLYEHPHFRHAYLTPEKDLHLYTSDTESHMGVTRDSHAYVNKPDDVNSVRTNHSRNY